MTPRPIALDLWFQGNCASKYRGGFPPQGKSSRPSGSMTFASGAVGYFETLVEALPECESEDFQAVVKRMMTLVDQFKFATSMDDLRRLRYTVTAFLHNPGMRLCRELASSFTTTEQAILTVGETTACLREVGHGAL